MKIDVVTLTGKRMAFEIDSSHTLDDLKDAVQETEGIPPDLQLFAFGEEQLGCGLLLRQIEMIRDLNEEIRARSSIKIWLISRLRGGGNRIYHRPDRSGDQSSDNESPREGRDQVSKRKLTRIKCISAVSLGDVDVDGDQNGEDLVRDQPVDRLSDSKSDDDRNGRDEIPRKPLLIRSRSHSPDQSPPLTNSEDTLSQNVGMSSRNLALVEYSSETSFSRDRLKKFGFGSKTAYPLEGPPITEKGSRSKEVKEIDIEKKKLVIEGGESQVLFEIPHSVTQNIEGKETNALYSQGIDQIIQGMYSVELFRSRMESEKHKVSSEQMPQMEQLIRMVSVTQFALDRSNEEILELREVRSELYAEIANLKKLAKDAGNQGYDRGYERAVKDIEDCIANEHPEWDLSFIQS